MNRTGASLVRHALEQLQVKFTFGIPGVHNTELYDELNKSEILEPVLVTHEGGGAFMADGISRTSNLIGTLVIVPAAGVTHAMSGIAEAWLDGVPMIVISGGIRTDVTNRYQLHEMDQVALMKNVTKFARKVTSHDEIVSTIFEAYRHAVSGEPGPVFIEIPVNIQLFKGEVKALPEFRPDLPEFTPDPQKIAEAAEKIKQAKKPGIFAGWGARNAEKELVQLAEKLEAPVSTTLQGLSVFPGTHPLHTGMGFGPSSVPASENAFKDCDCLIAIGTRFAEIPTGSFGAEPPANLIHIDINAEVFGKNYPTSVAIHGDARLSLLALTEALGSNAPGSKSSGLREAIRKDKSAYIQEWKKHRNERVNPAVFFEELRKLLKDDAFIVVDDGNHTFLAAELLTVTGSKRFISPTDFNCMGYAVPAAIGVKLANPDKQVVGIIGDGAFMMTAMEILTASSLQTGVVYFIFHDGELSQISQGQEIPYNRKTCTVIGQIHPEGVARATGAAYLPLNTSEECADVIRKALQISESGQPVIVDVKIDYSKRTRFTQGVVKTVLGRFPLGDKFRFIGRALWRKISG